MSEPTKKQILTANKLLAKLAVANPSAFLPAQAVDGVKFPCCACQRLQRWTDEQCKKMCQHYPL